LRKSIFAVSELSKATADDVCIRTGPSQVNRDKYLNELVRAGWLNRERIGKKNILFITKKEGGRVPGSN